MKFTNRQIEIIEAATKLIGEKGVSGLTTKNLAKEMKFSEPALYRHFKNKEEILKSVLFYYREDVKNFIAPILVGKTTGIEKIEQLFKYLFSHFKENPAIVLVIFSETSFQHNKLLSKTVLEIMGQKKIMMETILEFGQMDGSVRKDIPKNHLATIIMGSMRLSILNWRLNDFAHDLDDIRVELWRAIEKILK